MTAYVGEIRMFAGNFAPAGWAFCNGAPQAISEQETLFNLIGTTYGGDGQSTFNLPNLQSRIPLHSGTGPDGTTYTLAQMAGTETVTLTTQQIPSHNHPALASTSAGTSQSPAGKVLAQVQTSQAGTVMYGSDSVAAMSNQAIGVTGGSQPHENCQPFVCINYIISLYGIYPSPT